MSTPAGWYDVGDGFAGRWDGEQWTGDRIRHEQLRAMSSPPAPVVPPPPVLPERRRLTRRQLTISIGAVLVLPVLLVVGAALQPSKLERAGKAIGGECFTQEVSSDRIRFTANYKSVDCLLVIRAQLEELGFDRGALEDGADAPVRAGRYRLTVDDAAGPSQPTVTITAE